MTKRNDEEDALQLIVKVENKKKLELPRTLKNPAFRLM